MQLPILNIVFPFGWGELWGIADRTDYDLKAASWNTAVKVWNIWTQSQTKNTFRMCIEPSLGADRVALAFLVEAYDEEELEGGDTRVVMHLHPALAPIKAAVLPLSKKLDEGADSCIRTAFKEVQL